MADQDHWQDYIHLDIKDGRLALYTDQTLNTLWLTPEGRDKIRSAAYLDKDGHVSKTLWPITIREVSDGTTGVLSRQHLFLLDEWSVRDSVYEDGGTYHQPSMVSVFAHEFFHAADPDTYKENGWKPLVGEVAPLVVQGGSDSDREKLFMALVLKSSKMKSDASEQTMERGFSPAFEAMIAYPEATDQFNQVIAHLADSPQFQKELASQFPGVSLHPITHESLLKLASQTGDFTADGIALVEAHATAFADAFTAKYCPDDATRPQRRIYTNAKLKNGETPYEVPPLSCLDGQYFALPLGLDLPRGIAFGGDVSPEYHAQMKPNVDPSVECRRVVSDAKKAFTHF